MLLAVPVIAWANDPLGVSGGGEFEYVTSIEGIHEYRMPNSMQVLLLPDSSRAQVTVNVVYRVGSVHESYGETGMAHLLEHLIFKGTPDYPEIVRDLNARGMSFNGVTAFDYTHYYASFEPVGGNLEWVLGMEADRMVNSFISNADLQTEFSVVLNEMDRGENNAPQVLGQRIRAAAYQWHNYGKPTIGARSDVEGVDISRLKAFYRKHYQPDNATLIVAGDFDPPEAAAIIAGSFGAIPVPQRELPRIHTLEPAQDGERLVTLRRAGAPGAVGAGYHIPAGRVPESTALGMVATILSDSSRGRLNRKLVEPGIAAGAFAGADAFAWPGLFMLSAAVPAEGDAQSLLDALLEVAEGIAEEPITEREFTWARLTMIGGFENAIKNSGSLALRLSSSIGLGDWRYLFLYRDQLLALTLDDLNAAATKHFRRSNRTAGMLIPVQREDRVTVASRGDQSAELTALSNSQTVSAGEEFAATPDNIAARTMQHDLAMGGSLWAIEKKSRGGRIRVSLNLFFGSEKSLAGKHGVASYAAGQLHRGTARYTRDELANEWNRLKSQLGVSGGGQSIGATLITDEANFHEALALMAHVLREPVFDADQLEHVKRSSLANLAATRGQPESTAAIALGKAMSPHTDPDHFRYVMDFDERQQMIRALSRDDLADFWSLQVGFRGAVATAVGNVDSAALAGRLNELFGEWEAPVGYVPAPAMHFPVAPRQEWLDTPEMANGTMLAALPIQMNVRHADFPALSIAARIFGGGKVSNRLTDRLRRKEGWSYGAGAGVNAPSRAGDDRGVFFIRAIAAPENLARVKAGTLEELQEALEGGFTGDELQKAVDGAIAGALNSWSGDAALAGILKSGAQHGLDARWHGAMHQRYRALTLAEVNAAFRTYVNPDDFVIFIASDKATAETAARASVGSQSRK